MTSKKQKLALARDFYKSFNNNTAREFTLAFMISNYTEAILFHHPNKPDLKQDEIFYKCSKLLNKIFKSIHNGRNNKKEFYDLMLSLGRKSPNRIKEWFDEFDEAYSSYKKKSKLPFINNIFSKYLQGQKTMVDFGCGGGDITMYIANKNGLIPTGIDVLDWRSDEVKKNKMNFIQVDLTKEILDVPESFDVGIMHAVIHHIDSETEKQTEYVRRAGNLVKNKLLVVEDILYEPSDLNMNLPGIETIQECSIRVPRFREYLGYDMQTQKAIINILDVLSNSLAMGVPEMNFPFGSQTLNDWVKVFEDAGFEVKHFKCLGFQEYLFHRMSQGHFVLSKKAEK